MATGITYEDKVANQERLDGCRGPHYFMPCGNGPCPHYLTRTPVLVGLLRCSLCEGEVDETHGHLYRQGMEHGRASTPTEG